MNIALAQLNYIIGDFDGNLSKIVDVSTQASNQGSDMVVFSELAICGYPPLDLLEREDFIATSNQYIEKIANNVDPEIGILIGGPEFNKRVEGKLLYNAVFFLQKGNVQQVFRKTLLPTYDIFDEYRYFEPNNDFNLLDFKGKRIAITICEDLWDEQPFESEFSRSRLYTTNPLEELSRKNPDVIINLAASPFAHRKMEIKQSIFTGKAARYGLPVLYCNQVGAQTELIFEGGSLAVNRSGGVVNRLAFFQEDFAIFNLDKLTNDKPLSMQATVPDRIEMMALGLICGIKDYFGKMKFRTATLGLSGGIDSAVTLTLAAKAIGPENIHVLLLPSQYSSGHSIDDSVKLANNLGVKFDILHIETIFNQFRNTLKPLFGDLPEDIAEENIQARIRGAMLMALSNKFGNILFCNSKREIF